MPALTVAQLAQICKGVIEGDSRRVIQRAATLEEATEADLSFAANRKAVAAAAGSRAGCLLVGPSFDARGNWSLIRVPDPRGAFARAVNALCPKTKPAPGIHPTAIIAASAQIGPNCFIGAYATIGGDTTLGNGCSVGNGCAIGDRVSIGEETTLYAHVTIYDDLRIGSRVILHSGCVIGADGFGFTLADGHNEKFPQIGTVQIEDDVELGANCCVDRAALGVTRIGQGTKLDNLVHVGHNCDIGRHVAIAAQTGFSGSVRVGDYAVIGGQAGIGEKANIEAKAVVGGKAGILTGRIIRAGEPVWGIPARPLRQHLKGLAYVSKLPELREELKEVKRKLAALEAQADQETGSNR